MTLLEKRIYQVLLGIVGILLLTCVVLSVTMVTPWIMADTICFGICFIFDMIGLYFSKNIKVY